MVSPPKRFLQFLRWFCREEYLEEFEGDFIEIFDEMYPETPKRARRKFRWSVIRAFRYPFIKTPNFLKPLISMTMLMNNIKISMRTLRKQPFFTSLNALGLAIALAGCAYIGLYIQHELSFDRMFADAERIYRINIDNRTAGEESRYASAPGPLAAAIRDDFPHVESITRFRGIYSILLRPEGDESNVKEEHVVGADSSFFDVFGYPILAGEAQTALRDPHSLVITKSLSEQLFGDQSALGESMVIDNKDVYQITGVVPDFPENSFLRDYQVLMSISSFEDAASPAWNNWNFPTFVKLRKNTAPTKLQHFLDGVKERYLIPWAMTFIPGLTIESSREADAASGNYMRFGHIPLQNIHLHSLDREEEFNLNSNIQKVYILAIIGLLLLVLAIVNFMNLAIAQALKRSKEVGIRKTLGSKRSALVWRFLSEAALISLLSLFIAVGLSLLCMPHLNQIAGKTLQLPLTEPDFWFGFVLLVLVLALLCGLYPSVFLSRFQAVKILSGHNTSHASGLKARNFLLLFQFVISTLLILSTCVIFLQVNYIRNKELGYQKEQILVIEDANAAGDKLKVLREEILRLEQVAKVSLSSYLPTPSARSGITLFRDGKVLEPNAALIIGAWKVDYDYLSTLNLTLVAGRDFNRDFGRDSNSLILNETAVSLMGLQPEEAIGLRLTSDFHRKDKENMVFSEVIGVVKNFHYETLRNRINGLCMSLGGSPDNIIVRMQSNSFNETISNIETLWHDIAPGQPFGYYFLDDSFNETYAADQRLSRIFFIFTLLSIFVACLGLFGLSAFHAERKRREIGIRKILGASISQITIQLSRQFFRLIALGSLIAIPLGWYAMQRWLENFSFRITIPFWVVGFTFLIIIILAVTTVGFQTVRAFLTNPIHSLRQD